jgi:transposase-like protein
MEEESLRKMAVQQFMQGKSPVSIYQEMGRSKKWFFKWLKRYQSGNSEWYRGHSKAPHSRPHQTSTEIQSIVKKTRIHLEANPYAQVGVSAIKWQCQELGITLPSDRTINRILKKEGLIKKNTLYPQRSALPLFQEPLRIQQHSSGRSGGPPLYQERWPFLFSQYHGSLQSSHLSSSPTNQGRSGHRPWVAPMLEDFRNARLSSVRQRTGFPRKQSLPALLRNCYQTLSLSGNRTSLHPYWRTLA